MQNKDEATKPNITDEQLQEQKDRAVVYSVDLSQSASQEPSSDEKKNKNDDDPQSDEAKEHSSAVIAAYLRLGKPYPLIKRKKKGEPGRDGAELVFDSAQEAFTFFDNLAKDNIKFLSFEVDAHRNFTGNYYMSTGDGKLHDGKIEIGKIDELSNEFDAFMNATNQNSKNEALTKINELTNLSPKSTQNWRKELQNITQSQSQENVQAKEDSRTAPTPFKRTLKPD